MDEVAAVEEELLLERFKQQQALIQALVMTQRQLMEARDQALDRALLDELQMLSVSVMEARPLGKGKRYPEQYTDDLCDDDEIVYRSCGPVQDEELESAEDPPTVPLSPFPAEADEMRPEKEACLERQVEILSQILERLQSAGDELTASELKHLSSEIVQLSTTANW